jgi:hypothetical protein
VNLDEVFNLLNLTKDSSDADSQIWVRIVKAKYIEKPIDITGFAPKAATNYQIIGIDELVPERMTEDVGVVLQKTKDGFKYTLIRKSALRRTICIQCILLCSVQYKKRELRMPYARKITGFFRKKDTQSDSQPVPTAPPPPVRRRNSRVLFSPTTESPPPRRLIVRKTTTTEIIEETIPLQPEVYQKRKAPREPPPKYRRSDVPLYLYVLL